MKEIEFLILEINREEVEKRLLEIGAEKVFDGEVISILYDFDDERLTKDDSFIRLRKKGNKAFITYKKFIHDNDAKVCEEHEVPVSDFENSKKIFENIGLKEIDCYKKRRTSFKLGTTIIEIEKLKENYSHIPEFLEIEGESIEDLYKTAELLGFKKEDCKPWGGDKLKAHYKHKISFVGTIVKSMGKGAYFVEIYSDKLKDKLGFKPFPGTLNLKANPTKIKKLISNLKDKLIPEFDHENKNFGAVHCYEIKINDIDSALLIPEKATHSDNIVELIAQVDLRKLYNIEEGSELRVSLR